MEREIRSAKDEVLIARMAEVLRLAHGHLKHQRAAQILVLDIESVLKEAAE